jgi:preprotein translocase SecF subunit
MQIVPIDTKIDFLGARKKAFFLSGVMVTGSLLCVALLGLNQGIDFKGGSSAIVDFKKGALTDRSQLETSIAALIRRELNDDTTQVTVQDFSSGVQNTGADGTSIDRFIIYTEAPSLISAAKKLVIKAALEKEYAKGNKKPQVRYNEEGSDTYYLTLPEEADIKDTVASLKTLFTSGCAADGKPLKTPEALCYPVITVKSDEEQRLEVSNVKELNLLNQESQGKDLERMKQIKKKQLQEMAEKLDKKPDSRFTINIEELRVKIGDTLRADFGDKFVEVTSSTSVSPSVGKTLLYDGILAIFYAIIGILIYIVLRFDVRFAPGAVIALLHDVIITVGLFSLFQVKFSLPIIAALLTIVGYSLNDTIVVLDRVRETFNDLRVAQPCHQQHAEPYGGNLHHHASCGPGYSFPGRRSHP